MTTFENVIHAWIVEGSGLPGNKVIWWGQNSAAPSDTFISISITNVVSSGTPREFERPTLTGFETVRAGEEIYTVELQCFGGPSIGQSSPTSILRSVSRTKSQAIRELFETSNVVLNSVSAVRYVGAEINSTVFESRAVMTAEFWTQYESATFVDTIDNVQLASPTESLIAHLPLGDLELL